MDFSSFFAIVSFFSAPHCCLLCVFFPSRHVTTTRSDSISTVTIREKQKKTRPEPKKIIVQHRHADQMGFRWTDNWPRSTGAQNESKTTTATTILKALAPTAGRTWRDELVGAEQKHKPNKPTEEKLLLFFANKFRIIVKCHVLSFEPRSIEVSGCTFI